MRLTIAGDVGVAAEAGWADTAKGTGQVLAERAAPAGGARALVVVTALDARVTLIPRRAAALESALHVAAHGTRTATTTGRALVYVHALNAHTQINI